MIELVLIILFMLLVPHAEYILLFIMLVFAGWCIWKG